jgi:hypothetical protein
MKVSTVALVIVFLTASYAFADQVFHEDFTGGEGQFTGFSSSACEWHTPGDNSTFITYFGDDLFAEVAKSGCLQPFFNSTIISDSIDLSTYTGASLSFKHYYTRTGAISQGQVSISTDGGSSWTPVYTTSSEVTGEVRTVDISAADGASNVKVKFYFSYFGGVLASAWGLDEVTVTASLVVDDDTGDDTGDDTIDDDTTDDDVTDDTTDDDTTTDDDDEDNDIAYIYSYNLTRAQDFQTYLATQGYDVLIYQIAELDSAPDFSETDVFLIDADTSAEWDSTRTAAVLDTNKPIIGDGDGLQLMDGTDTYFGGGNFLGVPNEDSLIPKYTGHRIWNTPNDLGIAAASETEPDPVQILTSPMTLRALNDDGSSPLGVQFLGPCATSESNYALAIESGKFAVWAFGIFGPSMYTETGQKLLVNLIEYVKSEPVDIAYIYDTDNTSALAFQNYLESVGYFVEIFDVADVVSKADFSTYELFIVDDNAGDGSWSEEAGNVLINSGKPIIANNQGLHVFDYTENYLKIENTLALDPQTDFIPANLTSDLWNDPYSLGFTGDPVTVLDTAVEHLGLHDSGTITNGVELLGQDPAFLTYYPIAVQSKIFALWGFGSTNPGNFTQDAKELYINLIEYLEAGTPTDDDTGEGDDTGTDDTATDDDAIPDGGDDDDDDDGGCCGC